MTTNTDTDRLATIDERLSALTLAKAAVPTRYRAAIEALYNETLAEWAKLDREAAPHGEALINGTATVIETAVCAFDGRPIARYANRRPSAAWHHDDERGGRVCADGEHQAAPLVIEG